MEIVFGYLFVKNYKTTVSEEKSVKSQFNNFLKEITDKKGKIDLSEFTYLKLDLYQVVIYKEIVVLFRIKENYIIFLNIGKLEEIYK